MTTTIQDARAMLDELEAMLKSERSGAAIEGVMLQIATSLAEIGGQLEGKDNPTDIAPLISAIDGVRDALATGDRSGPAAVDYSAIATAVAVSRAPHGWEFEFDYSPVNGAIRRMTARPIGLPVQIVQ